jgi:hypothetical protein
VLNKSRGGAIVLCRIVGKLSNFACMRLKGVVQVTEDRNVDELEEEILDEWRLVRRGFCAPDQLKII